MTLRPAYDLEVTSYKMDAVYDVIYQQYGRVRGTITNYPFCDFTSESVKGYINQYG